MFKISRKEHKKEEKPILSKEYLNFLLEEKKVKEARTWYEKLCKFSEILRLKPPEKMFNELQKDIIFSTLNVSPTGVFSASILSLFFVGLLTFSFAFITNNPMIMILLIILPLATFFYIYSYPGFNAQVLKVQTGDEAIKIILYMVIYLKLHPSFEGAVNFAAGHAKGPITNDIKKAMWDLQTGKYKTVEQALSAYMPKWAIWNEDFVRSLSLLYGVLIEPSEQGREHILKKSLSYLLINTHRRMKAYVEDITGSINILHIMGMLLPVMCLIMFPMISMFLHETINPLYIGIGYTVFLPILLYFFMNRILVKRPSAFIVPDISKHPELPPPNMFEIKFGKKKVLIPILPLVILIGLVIMSYGIFHFIDLYKNLSIAPDIIKVDILKKEAEMGLTNLLATFSITFGFGLTFLLYFYLSSFQRIKIRNNIKNIEAEFQIGLFSIGNYLSEGYPVEKAMEKSLEEYEKLGMQKRPTFYFFSKLLNNIKNAGMTFKRALFDKKLGVILYFPSVLIEEIMRILSDASERSSALLGKISKTIGSYLEDLNTIEVKIRELLEDVRSGLKMQSGLVVPLICAMTGVLGIFLLNMLRGLSCQLEMIEKNLGLGLMMGATHGVGDLLNDLVGDFTKVMPMTILQAIVGVYTVEIVILLAMLLNGIENGFDKTSRDYLIAKTLIQALVVYAFISMIALILFQGVIVKIISTSGGAFVCQ